jgi:molybdopterin molybdotransferase
MPFLAVAAEVVDLGLERDDRRALSALLHAAAQEVDLFVSSDDVSGSNADHVLAAVGDAGGEARIFKLRL